MSTSPFLTNEQKEYLGFVRLNSTRDNSAALRALPILQRATLQQPSQDDEPTILPSDRSLIDILSNKFSLYDYGSDELVDVATEIFSRARGGNLLTHLSIDKKQMNNFIRIVRANYFDSVPYHNFRHVTCVLHGVHCFFVALEKSSSTFPFSDEEVFATMIAALCHDLQHPGVDNNYLAQSNDILAVRYNYVAILEQHHCACLMFLMNFVSDVANYQADVFQQFRQGANQKLSFPELKKLLATLIGATEVPKHDIVKKNIDKHVIARKANQSSENNNNIQNNTASSSLLSETERRDLLCGLLEASDIGNEVRDNFEDSKKWAARVHSEFFAAGDSLKSLGKPVFDSQNSQKLDFAGGQKWFITFMCKPIYASLNDYFGSQSEYGCDIFQTCLETLDKNLARWQENFGSSGENSSNNNNNNSQKGQQLMERELERAQFEMKKAQGRTVNRGR